MKKFKTANMFSGGFTLVELLVVIAVLGALAVVVILAIDPVQQLARARDGGRKGTVASLGHAVEALAVTRDGLYPVSGGVVPAGCPVATWVQDCLVTSGEIKIVPENNYTLGLGSYTAPTAGCQNNFCYITNAAPSDEFAVFAAVESQSIGTRCDVADSTYFVYASLVGRAGTYCETGGGVPTLPINGNGGFVD